MKSIKSQQGHTMVYIIAAIAAIIAIVGYVMNIVKFATGFEEIASMGGIEILRLIGIFFAPLGSIMGYIPV